MVLHKAAKICGAALALTYGTCTEVAARLGNINAVKERRRFWQGPLQRQFSLSKKDKDIFVTQIGSQRKTGFLRRQSMADKEDLVMKVLPADKDNNLMMLMTKSGRKITISPDPLDVSPEDLPVVTALTEKAQEDLEAELAEQKAEGAKRDGDLYRMLTPLTHTQQAEVDDEYAQFEAELAGLEAGLATQKAEGNNNSSGAPYRGMAIALTPAQEAEVDEELAQLEAELAGGLPAAATPRGAQQESRKRNQSESPPHPSAKKAAVVRGAGAAKRVLVHKTTGFSVENGALFYNGKKVAKANIVDPKSPQLKRVAVTTRIINENLSCYPAPTVVMWNTLDERSQAAVNTFIRARRAKSLRGSSK